MIKTTIMFALTLVMIACQSLESNARDTAAALGGAITAAQAQYQTQCTATPTLAVCTLINKAVAGQNVLVTATEAYCGWSQTTVPPDQTTKCVPVSTAQAGLQTAISNANTLVTQLKAVIK